MYRKAANARIAFSTRDVWFYKDFPDCEEGNKTPLFQKKPWQFPDNKEKEHEKNKDRI